MGMTTEEFWKKYGSQNSDSSSNNVTGENQPMTTDTFWQTYGSQEDLDARNFTRQFNKYKAEYDRLEQEEKKKAEQDRIQQEQNRPGLLGTMMASFQANLSDEKAGSSLKEALSGEREQFISPVNASGQPSQIGVRFLDTGERKQLPADQFNMLSPEGTIQLSKEERQKSLERFKTFSEEAKKYAEEAKRGGENSWFKQTAGDVAGSAKSYLSIPAAAVGSLAGPSGSAMGAVLGGIPAARQAFYTSYGQIAPYLLEQGVEPEKADEIATIYAVRQAGEEYAFELIPGIGKLKFGKNYFTRLASTGIKEAGSEVATELLQNADSYLSEQFADDPKVKSAFRKMNAESESDYVRVASAGLLGATAIGAVTTPMELAGERRAAAYDNLKKFLEAADPDTQEGAATANQALREAGVEPIADVTEQDTTAQDRGIDVTGPDLMRNPPPVEGTPLAQKVNEYRQELMAEAADALPKSERTALTREYEQAKKQARGLEQKVSPEELVGSIEQRFLEEDIQAYGDAATTDQGIVKLRKAAAKQEANKQAKQRNDANEKEASAVADRLARLQSQVDKATKADEALTKLRALERREAKGATPESIATEFGITTEDTVVPVAPTETGAQQVTPETTPVTPTVITPEAETTVEAPQQPVEGSSPITGTRKRKVVDDRQQAAEEVSRPLSPEETAAFRTEVAQKLTDMGISEQEAVEIAQADPNPRELVEPVTPQREEAAIKEQRLVPPNPRVQTTDKMEVAYDLTNEVENAEILERLEDSPIIRKTYEQELAKGEQGSVKNVLKAARMDSARTTPYLNSLLTFFEGQVDRFGITLEPSRGSLEDGKVNLGTYNRLTNAVAFNKASPETVAHEISHGLTIPLLYDLQAQESNPALKQAVENFQTLYDTTHRLVTSDRANEIKGFSEMRQWFTEYGIKNLGEFLAVGLNNQEFAQFLKTIPDPTKPRRSMWQSLKDFMVKALKSIGMTDTQGTALDALLDNFSTMMAVANQNPEMVKGAVGRMKERARKEVGLPPVDEMQAPDTEAFKKWFGDSKVVDENGEPLVVYHGTRADFEEFSTKNRVNESEGGMYFSPSAQIAAMYAGYHDGAYWPQQNVGSVIPVFLSIKNPLIVDLKGAKHGRGEAVRRAIDGGYDGVLIKNDNDIGGVQDQWVAFNPNQIKSATGNRGTFNPESAAIDEMSIPSRRATTKKKEENAKKKAATAESKAGFVAPATPASDVKAVADTLKQSWASKYLFGDPEKETAKDYLHNPFRNALRVVQRMLSSSRGVPVKLKEIIGWFHASTRKSVIQAEQYKNKIVYGISEINKKSPEKAEAILKAIDIAGNSELTVDEKAQAKERGQSYSEFVKERRLSAEAALRRADKKVYDDYRIFRELLDKNSVRMIRDIMKKRVLTDADAAKVRVIANNMGSYLTRAYRAHQGKHGKKYAKNLWKKWEDYKEGKIDADEDTEVVENALSRLKNYYTIGNFDEVDSVTGGQKELPLSALEALHEQWIARDETKVTPLRKNATEDQKQDYADGLIAELLSKKEELGSKEYENTLNAEAEKAAKGLLGLIDNIPNLVSIFKSVARQDMTILKERKLPVELRKLLGEITDPLVRMQSTAVAQATYIHRNKMLEEMLAVGKGVYFEDKAKADPDRFTAQMTGETLGPLEGLTATPRAAEIVKIFADLSKNMETTMKMALLPGREAEVAQNIIIAGLKKLGRLANVWKFGVVLLKPSNWFNNGVGGFLTVLKDGGAKPHHFAQAYRATSGLIGPAFKKYLPEETQRAIEMGMTDSSQAGELSEQLHQSLVDEALGPDGQTAWRRFSKWRKKKLFIFTDRYQALDLFWRTVAAFSEYEYQEKLAKAQGENLTQEQIARRAGVRMRARHMSYRDAMLLPKILEKGLFTTFITYHSETLRSWANTYLQGFQEIYEGQKQGGKAGTLKIKAGTQKVIGTTLAITARYHILKWLGSAIGYGIRGGVDLVSELYRMVAGDADDEDKARRERLRADAEKMERIKASMAKYHQSQMWDLFSVSKEGVPSFWEPGRLDPIDPTTNVLYGLMEGDVDKALSSAVGLLSGNPGAYGLVDLAIYAGKTVLNKAESNATAENPKKPSLARRYPETYERFRTGLYNAGVPKKVTDTLFFGAQLIGEPVMRPTMGLLAVDEDTKGKPVGPTILRAAGVQMAVLDKNYYQQTLRYEVQNEFAKTRKWLKDNIKPGTSKDRLRDDYAEAIEKERELANRAKEVVRGMQALGWGEDDIKEVLSNSGMSKTKQQEALSSTTMITSTILSERVLQGLIDDETMTRVELQTLIDAAGIRGIELEDKKEKGEKKEKSFGGMRGTKWR